MRISLISVGVAILCGAACSSSTKPLSRVPDGLWSDPTATLTVTDTGATFQMVCEADTIPERLAVASGGNFSWSGVAHVGTNIPFTPAHPAIFNGRASPGIIVITRTVTDDASITPLTHTLTPGLIGFAPCP
jgi:hypothetical protein